MDSYTLADAKFLNSLKHCVREVTRLLDSSQTVYPDTLEAAQVKHAIAVLVAELHLRGLLPVEVQLVPDATHVGQ